MPRIPGFRLSLALALIAIAGNLQSVRADLITDVGVSTALVAGGLTQYNYTLSDESNSTITASYFYVAVGATADLTMLTAPKGWDISYATGDAVVGFSSPDPSLDINPGSFGSFSFESLLTPVASYDAVAGLDSSFNYVQNNGYTLSASLTAVPEPSSALLCTLGILGAIGFHRRLKRNPSASVAR